MSDDVAIHRRTSRWCRPHRRRSIAVLLTAAYATGHASGGPAADLKRGELLYQTCLACHDVLGAGIGPDLTGVVGRKAGSLPGFDYSPALRSSGLTWDDATLRAFISNPQALVPGTRMTFPGYASPADVGAVIAYLKVQGAP